MVGRRQVTIDKINKKLKCRKQSARSSLSLKIWFSLTVTQGHWKWLHSIDIHEFLFIFHFNVGHILCYFRDRARHLRHWSKIAICSYFSSCITTPPPWEKRLRVFWRCNFHNRARTMAYHIGLV